MHSEWTTRRPPYPSCTGNSPAQRLSAWTRPRPTCNQDARLGKGAPSPQSGPPTHGRSSRNGTPRRGRCPAWGLYESTAMGRLDSGDSDWRLGLPPDHPGSQSNATAARRIGAGDGRRKDRNCASNPRGPLQHKDTPARKLPLSVPIITTPTRRSKLIDSEWRLPPDQPSASSQRPSARLTARNNDSEGCRTQEARIQPTAAAPQWTPRRGRCQSWIRH